MVGDNLYRILDSAADELLLRLEEAGKICRAKNRYVTIYRDLGRWNLEDGARPRRGLVGPPGDKKAIILRIPPGVSAR